MGIPLLIVTASSEIGGTERQVLFLAPALREHGFDAEVVSLLGRGPLTARLRDAGIEAIDLDGQGPIAIRRTVLARIAAKGHRLAYLFGLRTDALLRTPCRRAGCLVVSGIRNVDTNRRWYHTAIDRWSAGSVDLFIANSEAGRQSRIDRERFPAERIRTIPNGIVPPDLSRREKLRAHFRAEHRIPDDAWLLGLVANYRPQKGHLTALAAFESILRDVPNARLVFAGTDYWLGRIPGEVATRRLADRVLTLPHQSDLDPLYAALDLFLLPSDYEGMPNTLMEAMAWARPCLSTPVGGIPELLGPEGADCLVPARDSEALARAALRVWATPDRGASVGAALRGRIEREYSVAAMVRRHAETFRELLAARPG